MGDQLVLPAFDQIIAFIGRRIPIQLERGSGIDRFLVVFIHVIQVEPYFSKSVSFERLTRKHVLGEVQLKFIFYVETATQPIACMLRGRLSGVRAYYYAWWIVSCPHP